MQNSGKGAVCETANFNFGVNRSMTSPVTFLLPASAMLSFVGANDTLTKPVSCRSVSHQWGASMCLVTCWWSGAVGESFISPMLVKFHRASETRCALDSVPVCLWSCCSVSIPLGTVHRISWTFVELFRGSNGCKVLSSRTLILFFLLYVVASLAFSSRWDALLSVVRVMSDGIPIARNIH